MKKSLKASFWGLLLLGMTLTFSSCNNYIRIAPSPNLETKVVDIQNIRSIEVGSAFTLELIKSDEERLEVTANDNLFPYIVMNRERGEIKIHLRPNLHVYNDHYSVTIRFYYTDLTDIDLRGASRGIFMDSISEFASINIDLSGASSFDAGIVIANDIELDLSGVSKIDGVFDARMMEVYLSGSSRLRGELYADQAEVSLSGDSKMDTPLGTIRDLDATLSGASDWRGINVDCQRVDLGISGASSLWLTITESLSGHASGASSVYYKGSPRLYITESGASSVRPY